MLNVESCSALPGMSLKNCYFLYNQEHVHLFRYCNLNQLNKSNQSGGEKADGDDARGDDDDGYDDWHKLLDHVEIRP